MLNSAFPIRNNPTFFQIYPLPFEKHPLRLVTLSPGNETLPADNTRCKKGLPVSTTQIAL